MTNSWLRLWHDMPTDPKFRVIAKRSNRPLTEVVAVFVLMLTNASANATERGELDGWSNEDAAAALDTEPEHVQAIHDAMQGKTLDGTKLSGWEKRQPKREDSSAERAKAWRERKRTQENAEKRQDKDKDTEEDTDNKSPLPPLGEIDDPKPNVQPISDWKTAFVPQDEHEGIAIDCGRVTLVNGTRQFWEIQFDGDTGALDLAIIEANSDLNTGSRKPIKVQIERVLARIARERKDRSRNYAKAVERNAASKPGPAPGKKSALTIIAEMEASGAFAN